LYEKAMIQAANLDTMKSGNLKGARALPLLKKRQRLIFSSWSFGKQNSTGFTTAPSLAHSDITGAGVPGNEGLVKHKGAVSGR